MVVRRSMKKIDAVWISKENVCCQREDVGVENKGGSERMTEGQQSLYKNV